MKNSENTKSTENKKKTEKMFDMRLKTQSSMKVWQEREDESGTAETEPSYNNVKGA